MNACIGGTGGLNCGSCDPSACAYVLPICVRTEIQMRIIHDYFIRVSTMMVGFKNWLLIIRDIAYENTVQYATLPGPAEDQL